MSPVRGGRRRSDAEVPRSGARRTGEEGSRSRRLDAERLRLLLEEHATEMPAGVARELAQELADCEPYSCLLVGVQASLLLTQDRLGLLLRWRAAAWEAVGEPMPEVPAPPEEADGSFMLDVSGQMAPINEALVLELMLLESFMDRTVEQVVPMTVSARRAGQVPNWEAWAPMLGLQGPADPGPVGG